MALASGGSEWMDEHLAEICSRFSDACEYLELRVEEGEGCSITLMSSKVEDLAHRRHRGGCARALVRGSWGFVCFNDLDDLEHWARQAVDLARRAGRGEATLAPAHPIRDRHPLNALEDVRQVSLADKVALMRSHDAILAQFAEPITATAVGYADSFRRRWFANSDGSAILQETMDVTLRLTAIAKGEGTVQRYNLSLGSPDDFGICRVQEDRVADIARTAIRLASAPKVSAGVYPVVLDPMLAGVFAHEAIGHLSEADFQYENPRLAQLMEPGNQLGHPQLNVYDTGIEPHSRGGLLYDDEGVAAQRTDLIVEGQIVGRLHSRETAAAMGQAPTGSARAISYRFPPIVRMRHTCIGPGLTPTAKIFEGISRGIYAIDALGGQTNTEMFTFTAALGYLIEDGQLGQLVRDVTLSGNTFHTLKEIEMIGDEAIDHNVGGGCGKGGQAPLPVSHGGPHLRLGRVVVGGSLDSGSPVVKS